MDESDVSLVNAKIEIAISATSRGVVRNVLVKHGQTVRSGDLVMTLEET